MLQDMPLPTTSQAAAPGLLGLSEAERYFFELYGYLVVPDILTPAQVAEMNAAADACSEHTQRRDSPDKKLSGDVGRLQGEIGRIDTGELMQWPEPHCEPFRRLLSHRPAVKILLDLVGPGFHHSSANGIFMDRGAEGITMHGGQRSDGANGGRDAWTYSIDRNGQITCNLITIMYQLTDIGPDDGALVVIPASHKAHFNIPPSVRTFQSGERFGTWTGGELVRAVPCKAGSCIIFSEALSHGALPWVANHQRRTLLYRFAARGFQPGAPPDLSFAAELSPLGRAIMEPAHISGRPDLAKLLAEEEAAAQTYRGCAKL
jgi:hypothetical protein